MCQTTKCFCVDGDLGFLCALSLKFSETHDLLYCCSDVGDAIIIEFISVASSKCIRSSDTRCNHSGSFQLNFVHYFRFFYIKLSA